MVSVALSCFVGCQLFDMCGGWRSGEVVRLFLFLMSRLSRAGKLVFLPGLVRI